MRRLPPFVVALAARDALSFSPACSVPQLFAGLSWRSLTAGLASRPTEAPNADFFNDRGIIPDSLSAHQIIGID